MFLHITSQIEGRKDDGLLSKKGLNSFPSFVFLDAGGAMLAKHQATSMADMSMEGFERTASGPVKEYLDLKAKAASGDKGAIVQLALKEATMGSIADGETLKKRLAGMELTAEQKTTVSGLMTDFKFAKALKAANALFKTDQATARKQLGAAIVKILNAGEMPTKKYAGLLRFAFGYCLKEGELGAAEKALEGLNAAFGDSPRAAGMLDAFKTRLAEAKAEKADEAKDGAKEKETEEPKEEEIEESDGDG